MTRASPRDAEAGVILINVLVILALATSIVYLMLGSQDAGIDRIRNAADATQAEILALGAEASVIDALRRDMDTGPEADHFGEPWAAIAQQETQLATGRFSVSIRDAQAKFDINRLASPSLTAQAFLERLLVELDLPERLAGDVAAVMRAMGPVSDPDTLSRLGVPRDVLDRLAPYVTALPVDGALNLNTADPVLLRVALQNPGFAARLQRARDTDGQVSRATLDRIGALRPESSGYTSNVFDVDVVAEVGLARIRLQSRLVRTSSLTARAVGVFSRKLLSVEAPPPDREAPN